jgi:hypothetical protein
MLPRVIVTALALAAAAGCARSDKSDTTEPRVGDGTPAPTAPTPGAPAPTPTDSKGTPMTPTPALSKRIDLDLQLNKPTPIDALGVTVTLLDAGHVTLQEQGRMVHRDRAVVRFERTGEAPQEVTFGPGGVVKTLYGHEFAVFGGQRLTVFPPGQPAMP